MRISKKHQIATRQILTMNNREQHNTENFESYCQYKLIPDLFDSRKWTESLIKGK